MPLAVSRVDSLRLDHRQHARHEVKYKACNQAEKQGLSHGAHFQ